jgi:hypothetical protein
VLLAGEILHFLLMESAMKNATVLYVAMTDLIADFALQDVT